MVVVTVDRTARVRLALAYHAIPLSCWLRNVNCKTLDTKKPHSDSFEATTTTTTTMTTTTTTTTTKVSFLDELFDDPLPGTCVWAWYGMAGMRARARAWVSCIRQTFICATHVCTCACCRNAQHQVRFAHGPVQLDGKVGRYGRRQHLRILCLDSEVAWVWCRRVDTVLHCIVLHCIVLKLNVRQDVNAVNLNGLLLSQIYNIAPLPGLEL